MNEKVFGIYQSRFKNFLPRLKEQIEQCPQIPQAEYIRSEEAIPFAERLNKPYSPIHKGDTWGEPWDSAWFHLTCVIPPELANRELSLFANFTGELLLFDEEGTPIYALTGASIFSRQYRKERYVLPRTYQAGEVAEFWIEGAANQLWGIPDDVPPQYHFQGEILEMKLCVFEREVWQLSLDVEVLISMMASLGQYDHRSAQILHALNRMIEVYNYKPANAAAARDVLKPIMSSKNGGMALKTIACGHAHIDVGWLWEIKESTRKAARTFSSQLALMEKYPDYVFGASQPYLYQVIKDTYPVLYDKIKERVKEGRWEVQGGMWVEADSNLTSGESLIRQFLHGKNFFMDEFGIEVKNLWLVDVFGYSAALPQIIRKSGCDYFITQKLCWSQINRFPHHTMWWKGVDGTKMLTHFVPENTYNSKLMPEGLMKAQRIFAEGGYVDQFITLFGIGDGGGGPSEDYVERGLRLRDLDGVPKLTFGKAQSQLEYLDKYASEIPTWDGELYLELHRGTLTSQARVKRQNRKCEQSLVTLEFLLSQLPLDTYPHAKMDAMWKKVLLHQFHDILPGSSIRKVNEETEQCTAAVLAQCGEMLRDCAADLFKASDKSAVVVNSLSYDYTMPVCLPEAWRGYQVLDADGQELPVEADGQELLVSLNVPAHSFVTLFKGQKQSVPEAKASDSLVLENELIRYEFNQDAQLIRAFDKVEQRDVLTSPGNILSVYNDFPNTYDAWDVELFYVQERSEIAHGVSSKGRCGKQRSTLTFTLGVCHSTIEQKIMLHAGSRRLDFETRVDWHEAHKLLRTAFPVNVFASDANYDIQYSHIKRPMHQNTSWDVARFEAAGQRYADISDQQYGVALLNDCKYGYRVKDSVLDLALLRSPKHPDPEADQGKHLFTYALLPHVGDLTDSQEVFSQAAMLNRPVSVFDSLSAVGQESFCTIKSDSITLEVVKKAEKEDCRIIRMVENAGRQATGELIFHQPVQSVVETNLIEWENGQSCPVVNGRVAIAMKPFEIKTFKVK